MHKENKTKNNRIPLAVAALLLCSVLLQPFLSSWNLFRFQTAQTYADLSQNDEEKNIPNLINKAEAEELSEEEQEKLDEEVDETEDDIDDLKDDLEKVEKDKNAIVQKKLQISFLWLLG